MFSRIIDKWLTYREYARRRHIVNTKHTDVERWRNTQNYQDHWTRRMSSALSLRGDAEWVCDLGCGSQKMRNLLPKNIAYLPMDIVKWTNDTCVCEINQKILSNEYLAVCDLCYLLGVLEYIYEPSWLFDVLAVNVETVVL